MTQHEATATRGGAPSVPPLVSQARLLAIQWVQVRDDVSETAYGALPPQVRRSLDMLADIVEHSQSRPMPVQYDRPPVFRTVMTCEGGAVSLRRRSTHRNATLSLQNGKGRDTGFVILNDVSTAQLVDALGLLS